MMPTARSRRWIASTGLALLATQVLESIPPDLPRICEGCASVWEDWDPRASGVIFSVEAEADTYMIGAAIDLQPALANWSDRDIHFGTCHGWAMTEYDISVFYEDGTEVRGIEREDTPMPCISNSSSGLAPGLSATHFSKIPISEWYAFNRPGKYRVLVHRYISALPLGGFIRVSYRIDADEVVFEIKQRPSGRPR